MTRHLVLCFVFGVFRAGRSWTFFTVGYRLENTPRHLRCYAMRNIQLYCVYRCNDNPALAHFIALTAEALWAVTDTGS